jgi:tetratricopeptide (TPR) repeat protein
MRLLERNNAGEISLTRDFINDKAPSYAILSHTWGTEEVSFKDLADGTGRNKLGPKIRFCGDQAWRDGLQYFWVDTCCIDKSSSAELQEAINCMFRWYRDAAVCYVYLADVSRPACDDNRSTLQWQSAFRKSKWFTRGWTLQELISPASVEFFSKEGVRLGNKTSLERLIHDVTGIPIEALRGSPLHDFSVSERMAWIEDRETTRKEDKAYSLLGIFDVQMPLLYGEGRTKAFKRLLEEIDKTAKGELHSLLARCHPDTRIGQIQTQSGIQFRNLISYCTSHSASPPVGDANFGSHIHERNATHWIVPLDRNKNFVGRELILADLLEKIPPGAEKDACQRTAIEGLGGVGKTQVALEAAFRIREKDPNCSVFWVPAIDTATFESAYRDIGRQLHIQGAEEDKADVKLLVRTALSESAHRWLLIIDNADDIGLLLGTSGATPLFDYLPSSHNGSILFTTRSHEVVRKLDIPRASVVRVTELSRHEAEEMLRLNLEAVQLRDSESTAQLLDLLADLPLAIRQASAYMDQTGLTATKYLDHCRSSDKRFIELLSTDFADRGRYKAAQNPIATTWLISFHHISQDNSLAAQYLQFMSFLAEKDIPKSLLPPGNGELEADEAIAVLKAYAFISIQPDQDSYDMHRLVPLAMRNWLAKEGKLQECVTRVIERLAEVFPVPEHENRAIWEKYLPHSQRVLEFQGHSIDNQSKWRLLGNVGESNSRLGKYKEAEEMYRQALVVQAKTLDAQHPDILLRRNNLATTLRHQGKYTEAEEIYRQALVAQTTVLGFEHPDTLKSSFNLASALHSQGKYKKAEEIYQEALVAQTTVLGFEHPDTLMTRHNLASALSDQRKYTEAEEMYWQILAAYMKVLGAEHPDTLKNRHNLANMLHDQGKYTEFEEMCQQTLAAQTKVLGAEHPDTLRTRHDLTSGLCNQRKYTEQEAEEIYWQILTMQTKVLGTEHPHTLGTGHNLATALHNQWKYREAEEMYWQILTAQTKVLGAEHPHTLRTRNNLAATLRRLE